MQDLYVFKYGGSSLSTPDKIIRIAERLGQLHQQGHKLIVVVSAMGKGTDKLIELAHKVAKSPARREMDMLISTGERVSMSLMSMALQSLGHSAISFTGSQSGILTNQVHNKARIKEVKPIRIEQALSENKIVIVAGFQGVDPQTKEITTLGRGGSDTTAVSLAAHFKAKICKTLKDVDGVFSTDPKLYPQAQLFKQINYKTLKNMCFWGSPILHYRSVALAEKLNVPLFVGNSTNDSDGTIVNNKDINMYEKTKVLAVNAIEQIVHISIDSTDTADGYKLLNTFLLKHNLSMPRILASAFDKNLRLMLTDSKESLAIFCNEIKKSPTLSLLKDNNSSLTLTYNGAVDFNHISEVTDILKQQSIDTEKVINSSDSFTFIIKNKDLELSKKVLCKKYL